jgi:transposase InsO family protein
MAPAEKSLEGVKKMAKKISAEAVLKRIQAVSELVQGGLTDEEVVRLRKKLASSLHVSDRTLRRWVERFRNHGAEGLTTVPGRPAAISVIPENIINHAIDLRREVPNRSVASMIKCMEMEGLIEEGSVKRSTLQDCLFKRGYGATQFKLYREAAPDGGRRFQRRNSNDLWQADTKHFGFIGKKKVYLIAFIDDCTRFVVHSEFYFDENAETVMDCLRKAIEKYGAPKAIYLDNGSPYKSNSLERACSQLAIKKIHHQPYCPRAKGKIERFNHTVSNFHAEAELEKIDDLKVLNTKWSAYLNGFYQWAEHSALPDNMAPQTAFKKGEAELCLVKKETLDYAFLMVEHNRRVDKTGCVSLKGVKYSGEGIGALVGKKVDLVWPPTNRETIWVEYPGVTPLLATPIKIGEFLPKIPKRADIVNKETPQSSRYIEAARKADEARKAKILKSMGSQPKGSGPEDGASSASSPSDGESNVNGNVYENKNIPLSFITVMSEATNREGNLPALKFPVIEKDEGKTPLIVDNSGDRPKPKGLSFTEAINAKGKRQKT